MAQRRARQLAHGINASHWFAQSRDYSLNHLKEHTTAEDISLIKEMGFDHVRLSLEPSILASLDDPQKFNSTKLHLFKKAVEMILSYDLAVIVDVHPSSRLKDRVFASEQNIQNFAVFWERLARELSELDADKVFLEVINEPEIEDAERWYAIQQQWVEALRRGAPSHTIIVTGHRWSGPEELLQTKPLADPNLIYTFHYYRPHTFTHQGAGWGADYWVHIRDLPYPSSPQNVEDVAARIEDEEARGVVLEYGKQRWNKQKIQEEIRRIAQWRQRHGVPIICNEFGVYRRFVGAKDRAAWLGDVRSALESEGIGWTMWDYQGGFSVVNTEENRTPDRLTLQALNLLSYR